jgi:uncharacterized protein YyaL (SSP411 family)
MIHSIDIDEYFMEKYMPNRLANETSPYLLQHADNPVDWYPWSEEAFVHAREADKPIFLSIGYAACHWCHVMAHESFEDPETAALMNQNFINIKVDREERPDLDALYMDAVVALTGQGGWPMSVFLTPDGKPFHGGTYFPPVPRFNMPSFTNLLQTIAKLWHEDRERLIEVSTRLSDHISNVPSLIPEEEQIDPSVLDRAAEALFRGYDWKDGGWGSAPKFPQSMVIEFLFRRFDRSGDKLALDMATHALRSMARGGMYDLIGGGFHRYSVDDHWLVPHFEKMLYDNALLIRSYLHAWQITREPFFRQIAEESLSFLKREMLDPSGGFYSSLDADSEGEEGLYYIWTLDEVKEVIGDETLSDLVIQAYGLTQSGNFEGRNIPNRAIDLSTLSKEYGHSEEEVEKQLAAACSRLLTFREKRISPGLDDKILTAWNGLLLSSLSIASRILDSEDETKHAQQLGRFLLREMITEGGLQRSWRQGAACYTAYLEDHAALGLGLLELYQLDFNPDWYQAAVDQGEQILAHFIDAKGGFFDTRDDHERLIARPKSLQDNPTPSGNTLAISLLLRLAALTGDSRYLDPAEAAIRAMQGNAARHPTAFAGWLSEMDFILGPQLQLAIMGSGESMEFQALKDVFDSRYLPRMVMAGGLPDVTPQPGLLEGRQLIEGKPTAYLCQGFTCKLPTTSPEILEEQLHEALGP